MHADRLALVGILFLVLFALLIAAYVGQGIVAELERIIP